MTTSAEWIKVAPERLLDAFQREAVEKITGGQGEVVLDFSSVARIDSEAVGALERLAGLAADRSVRVVLRAVNGDIYKVLKLLKLTERFGFPI
ncbi:MAG: STAS domain-containing protein [Bryobacteraceae bacterium]